LTLAGSASRKRRKSRRKNASAILAPRINAHFPKAGRIRALLVVRPDTVIEEFDVVRNPSAYARRTFFSPSRSRMERPCSIRSASSGCSRRQDFEFFEHILLANEHDEYVAIFRPPPRARNLSATMPRP